MSQKMKDSQQILELFKQGLEKEIKAAKNAAQSYTLFFTDISYYADPDVQSELFTALAYRIKESFDEFPDLEVKDRLAQLHAIHAETFHRLTAIYACGDEGLKNKWIEKLKIAPKGTAQQKETALEMQINNAKVLWIALSGMLSDEEFHDLSDEWSDVLSDLLEIQILHPELDVTETNKIKLSRDDLEVIARYREVHAQLFPQAD